MSSSYHMTSNFQLKPTSQPKFYYAICFAICYVISPLGMTPDENQYIPCYGGSL